MKNKKRGMKDSITIGIIWTPQYYYSLRVSETNFLRTNC